MEREQRPERETTRDELLKSSSPSELRGPPPEVPEEVKRVPNDNWRHRSKMMLCDTCMYNVLKDSSVAQLRHHCIGRCRRNAPTMQGWPVVFSDDWCGNHKLDEEKV